MGDTKRKRGREPKNRPKISPEELPAIVPSRHAAIAPPVDWQSVANAVVKVLCDHSEPNFLSPWQYSEHRSSTSGFVISGRRVLTNAHSLEHYTELMLQKRHSCAQFLAKVLAISVECDIAMLTVDEDEFWEGISPLEFADLGICDDLTLVGYPIGSDSVSVSRASVWKIEIASYVHGSPELMHFQKHGDNEKIGYVIPTPIITHFIRDYEKNGKYTGFPILGAEWQALGNPFLRMEMGLETDQSGVRGTKIDPTAPVSQVLKESDIIQSFDGVDIDNYGKFSFFHGGRIKFTHLVSQKYDGDEVVMKVLRNSRTRDLNFKLESGRRLIPAHTGKPSYYIVAGFVFTTLSAQYLDSKYEKYYKNKTRVKLLDKLLLRPYDEPVVLVSKVLPVNINSDYEDFSDTQVVAFNGKRVKNLKSLVSMVESCDDKLLKFKLEFNKLVVLETKYAKAATLDVLARYCIPSAMSDDLKPEDG